MNLTPSVVASKAAQHLSKIRLFQFRNYASLQLGLEPGVSIFVGDNAQGKSNLLEAVASVLLTKSPRAANNTEVLQWGCIEAAVDMSLMHDDIESKVGLRIHAGERATRQHLLDGSSVRASEILGRYPVVSFWPDELQLIKAGPELRRRWLDQIAVQSSSTYRESRSRYRHCLEQRNGALRQLRAGTADLRLVRSFDPELVLQGSRLMVARSHLLSEIGGDGSLNSVALSGQRDELSLRYLPNVPYGEPDVETVATAFREMLQQTVAEEYARALTVAGPHRDDVEISINDHPARSTASQGQQRGAVLALKLAEVRYFSTRSLNPPLVLLDDVLSELDPERRTLLLETLQSSQVPQTLITTTSDLAASLVGHRYHVSAGTIETE